MGFKSIIQDLMNFCYSISENGNLDHIKKHYPFFNLPCTQIDRNYMEMNLSYEAAQSGQLNIYIYLVTYFHSGYVTYHKDLGKRYKSLRSTLRIV